MASRSSCKSGSSYAYMEQLQKRITIRLWSLDCDSDCSLAEENLIVAIYGTRLHLFGFTVRNSADFDGMYYISVTCK